MWECEGEKLGKALDWEFLRPSLGFEEHRRPFPRKENDSIPPHSKGSPRILQTQIPGGSLQPQVSWECWRIHGGVRMWGKKKLGKALDRESLWKSLDLQEHRRPFGRG